MGALGFIRLGVWQNFIRAWRSGHQGNMNGEGFILGGVFVIGPGDQVEQIRWTLALSTSLAAFTHRFVSKRLLVFAGDSAGTPREGVWQQGGHRRCFTGR